MMTNIEKLKNRLKENGVIDGNITWGPEGYKLSAEEKAGEIIKMLNAVDANALDTVSVPRSIIRRQYEANKKLNDACKIEVENVLEMSEKELNWRSLIMESIGLMNLELGRYIKNDD